MNALHIKCNGTQQICPSTAPRAGTVHRQQQRQAARVRLVRHVAAKDASATEEAASVPRPAHSSSSSSSSEQQCPFLSALSTPPSGATPWFKRLGQLFRPDVWQKEEAGQHPVVVTPAALGLPEQYVVGDGELAQAVFNAEPVAMRRALPNTGLAPLLGSEHLLAEQDPQHKYLRGLMMPAFTADSIASLTPRMTAVLGKYLNRWADAGGLVNGCNELKLMTFEFIIAVVMGRDYPDSTLSHLNDLFRTWMGGLRGWPYLDLPFTRFHRAVVARRGLISWLQGEVDQARQAAAAGHSTPGVLGKLLAATDEQGNRLTASQLTNNLLVLLFAGHDTSSSTLNHVLKQLQHHPQAVAALQQEQADIVARWGSSIDGRVLKEMVYAEAVIRETLRLDTIVAGLFRQATKDYQLGKFGAPAGMMMYLPLQLLASRDPRWAGSEDVDEFKPERLLGTVGQKQGWLLPFGYGPRFCVGYNLAMAEMKVFLALLVRGYSFSADTNTSWEASPTGYIPKNGLPLTITRR